MTSATIPGLDTAPTKHQGLLDWVREVAELTQPDRVVFADGSEDEYQRLCEQLVAADTSIPLSDSEEPRHYLARSDPRLGVRRGLDAHHDPDGQGRPGEDG